MVTDGVLPPALEMVVCGSITSCYLNLARAMYYERCALFGVMGAGLVGAIAPKNAAAIRGNGYLDLQRARRGSTTGGEHTDDSVASPPFGDL